MSKPQPTPMKKLIKNLVLLETVTNESGEPIDPFFSWLPCECCGDTLGGDRYEAYAFVKWGKGLKKHTKKTLSICPDCISKWQ